MIYTDPTEMKVNTRLHKTVRDWATVMQGLEMVTGADLLVTTQSAPEDIRMLDKSMAGIDISLKPRDIANATELSLGKVLTSIRFLRACQQGALVQRKTARDILTIIPNSNGARILEKMQRWCSECWLVVTSCRVSVGKDGQLKINRKSSSYHWNQLRGALTDWQRRGGYTIFLPNDKDLLTWIHSLTGKIQESDKVITNRKRQHITRLNKQPWRLMLLQVPGWGPVKTTALADVSHTFAAALENLSCPEWLEPDCGRRPKRIHVKDVRAAREFFGLVDDHLQIVTEYVPEEEKEEEAND